MTLDELILKLQQYKTTRATLKIKELKYSNTIKKLNEEQIRALDDEIDALRFEVNLLDAMLSSLTELEYDLVKLELFEGYNGFDLQDKLVKSESTISRMRKRVRDKMLNIINC